MKKITLALIAAILLPVSAQAIDDEACWTDCKGTCKTNQPSSVVVSPGSMFCYEWENQLATADTPIFSISDQAEVIFLADKGDTDHPPAGGGQGILRRCFDPSVATPAACQARLPSGCSTFTGADGDASTQCAQINVAGSPRTPFYFDLTVAVPDGDEAILILVGGEGL